MKIFKKLMEGLQWVEATTLQHIAGIFFIIIMLNLRMINPGTKKGI